MTDASVRVPEISPKHDGKEVDCEIIERNGVSYYRQRTEVIGFTDHYGTKQYIAPNGELVSLPLYKLVGDSFATASLDPNMWASTLVAGGTAEISSGELLISTNTTANGSATVESVSVARFIGLGPNKFRSLFRFAVVNAPNNTRDWGVDTITQTDGALFRISNGVFSIVTKKGGIETVIADGSTSKPFNGQYGTTYTIDNDYHNYEVIYQPRQVVFTIDDKILHTAKTTSSPWSNTLHLHAHFQNTNTGGSTTNVTMQSLLGVVSRFGIPETQEKSYHQSGITAGTVIKVGPGDLHGLTLSALGNNTDITIYDNTAASGRILFASGPMPANTTPLAIDKHGINFNIGLTIVIATTTANVDVYYD
jgi:hypothetical protein